MSQKYSINDILKAVDSINPENRSERKFANEEILGAIEELNKKKIETKKIDSKPLEIITTKTTIEEKKFTKQKIKKKEKIFTKPFLLTNIIKYEPVKSKALFLKKLYNSHLKIIAMKAPGVSR
jgi:hypothetical protein